MKRFVCLSAVLGITSSVLFKNSAHAQTVLAGWDFQTTTNGGTAAASATNTPTVFTANIGTGTLYLNGTNGASAWSQATELEAFTGTAVNAAPGMATSTASPACLGLQGGTSNSANGKSMVFRVNTTGYATVQLTYATQRSGTGFTTHTWAYSTNGTTWTAYGTFTGLPSTFGAQSLPGTAGAANAGTAYFRLTVTGSISAGSNNRIDNVQILGSGTPLPLSLPRFSAERRGSSVLLQWQAAGETDGLQYVVERSRDGAGYDPLAMVTAEGAGLQQLTDAHPETGAAFYRLKLVETTGRASYSSTVRVAGLTTKPALRIAPNPVRGGTFGAALTGLPQGSYQYRIFAADGRLLQEGRFHHGADGDTHTFSVSNFSPGLVHFTFTGPGMAIHQMLTIE